MCKVCYLQSLQFAIGAPHMSVMLSALDIPIGLSFNGILIQCQISKILIHCQISALN